MKIRTLASCLAVGLWILAQSASASQRTDLEKQGLKSVTGKEVAEFYVGKTCTTKGFDEAGKVKFDGSKTGSKNIYKRDGTLIKTKTIDGSPDTRNRKWWMDGSSFCETMYDNDKPWCGAHKAISRLGDKFLFFSKKGAITFEVTCK